MEDRNYEGMKTDGSYHVVELEKGIKSEIPVYEYNNHIRIKCAFHIHELHITNIFENEEEDADAGEAVVDVLGCFREEFPNRASDNTVYFVYGDIVVPAKSGMESVYEATILPNLPGGVKFFVSLDGIKAASQVMKFGFPSKPARSEAERDLEERLAHLLLFNKEDRQESLSRLRQCDNKDTHTEIVLREYLQEWIFDDRKSAYSLDDEGQGVIHLVASLGYAWAIGILRRLQFILDFKDAFGWTPLHWAAFHGRSGVVTALLVGGADPALRTEQATKCFPSRCAAADIAARSGHDLLAAYLEKIRLEPSKILRLPPPVQREEPRYLYTYRRYLSTNRQGLLKAEGTHHPVEFEKGLKSDVTVYESDNHHQQNCPFHIAQLYIDMDADSQEPIVKVFGEFQKDKLPPNEANPLFVFGDLVVSAQRVSEGLYKSIFLPNVPGGYDFYVSLDGITPISQILKIECPSRTKKMSDVESGLHIRLARLLVANDDNLKCLSRKFAERDMKKLPNEVVTRELVKQWIFEGCKIGKTLDEQGQGVLHLVASLGYDWAIALCARNGFSVDSEDAFGWTALHWAAYYGRKEAAMALLISGADPSVLTKPTTEFPDASKAANIARRCGHDDVALYLEKGSKVQRKRLHPLGKRGKSRLN